MHEVSQKGFVGSSNGSDQAASRKDANNAIQPRESANVPEVTGKGKEEIADDQQKDERLSQNQDVLDELLSKGSILAKALQGDEALPEQPPSRLEASTSKIPSRKDQISVSKSSDAPHSENLKSELLEEDARKNNGSNGMEKEQSVQSSRSMNSKGKNDNSSMQGSTTAVVRALKEMSAHRETLEKSIRELVR